MTYTNQTKDIHTTKHTSHARSQPSYRWPYFLDRAAASMWIQLMRVVREIVAFRTCGAMMSRVPGTHLPTARDRAYILPVDRSSSSLLIDHLYLNALVRLSSWMHRACTGMQHSQLREQVCCVPSRWWDFCGETNLWDSPCYSLMILCSSRQIDKERMRSRFATTAKILQRWHYLWTP